MMKRFGALKEGEPAPRNLVRPGADLAWGLGAAAP
jgi:hypothetical protein